jgi:CRISPR/Cas system CMR subunit Cmr4 (Cas7 group RAMP superfamily)
MLYLLDANVLMTAHSLYYPVDAVPEFWAWLAHQCVEGRVKMPIETYEEVKDGSKDTDRDLLFAWIQQSDVRRALVLVEEVDPVLVRRVTVQGYASDLTDDEIEQIGRDPFLIAHALASPQNRCVVTTEASKPSKQRQNRRIPDVCSSLGVQCVDTFTMLRALRFSTNWNASTTRID